MAFFRKIKAGLVKDPITEFVGEVGNLFFNIETGEKLKCKHNVGKCKDEPQCFSTCFQQVGNCKGPYMIQVERNNLIGLGAK